VAISGPILDLFDLDGQDAPMSMKHGWHPHSGIATMTVVFDGAIRYAETTGSSGMLPGPPLTPRVRCTISRTDC
jgi:redox-sensitive bicupin YhaK (pirin superfamily)